LQKAGKAETGILQTPCSQSKREENLGLFLGFWENDPVLLVGVEKPTDFVILIFTAQRVNKFVTGMAWMLTHRKPLIL
jgi:hypothetical protein